MDISAIYIGSLAFVVLIILIMLSVHVALALCFVGFVGMLMITGSFSDALPILLTTPYNAIVKFSFMVIPLFILMGTFAFHGDFGNCLYDSFSKILGRIPGGLLIATTWACLLFGACSGSNVAAAALFGKISLPEFSKRNYDMKFSVGAVVTSSMLTAIFPPSIFLIIYGVLCEQPIGRLLIAGIIPSIIFSVLISFYIFLRVRIKPTLAPVEKERFTLHEKLISLKGAWFILVLAVFVLGGIYSGIFTPTEAAATGSFVAFILFVSVGKCCWRNLKTVLFESLDLAAMIFFILIGAFVFSRFLAISGFSNALLSSFITSNISNIVFILIICVIYLFLGCFIDIISIMAITLPIVYPAVIARGYDGIWFGIVVLLLLLIGAMTPPFGLAVFTVKNAVKMDLSVEECFIGCIPYLSICAVMLAILIAFPDIILFLPNLMLIK